MAINFPTNPTNGQTFVALGRGWQYNSTSGSWEALIRVNTAFDSDDVHQGTTNLYATNESIDDRVGALIQAGNNITVNYDDANNQLTLSAVAQIQHQTLYQTKIISETQVAPVKSGKTCIWQVMQSLMVT